MKILLTNDDGIRAPGIAALVEVFSREHDVTVVAPATQQSAMSHALTVWKMLEVSPCHCFGDKVRMAVQVFGSPADCVKLYMEELVTPEERPDLVISGINCGANLGTDIHYSGTVGAAIEGYFHHVSAFAVSLNRSDNMQYLAVAEHFATLIPALAEKHAAPFLLNVNYPKEYNGGERPIQYTKIGTRDYVNAFQKFETHHRTFYYVAGEIYDHDNDKETDLYVIEHDNISVTPINTDLTDYASMRTWK